jgi:hypothetical protein
MAPFSTPTPVSTAGRVVVVEVEGTVVDEVVVSSVLGVQAVTNRSRTSSQLKRANHFMRATRM